MSRPASYDLPLYKAGEELLFLQEDKIRFMQDIFFFINHESHNLIIPVLQEYELGLAHFRLMQFVCHYPGITVGELRSMLGITKQSLNRVLREMLETGYLQYRTVPQDKRKKTLFLTSKGEVLEKRIFNLQRQQFVRAFRETSNNAHIEGFQRVLYGMVSQETKKLLEHQSVRKKDRK